MYLYLLRKLKLISSVIGFVFIARTIIIRTCTYIIYNIVIYGFNAYRTVLYNYYLGIYVQMRRRINHRLADSLKTLAILPKIYIGMRDRTGG